MAQASLRRSLIMDACMFSLILATYGRADDVGRLVASLRDQTFKDFELIVVDQNVDERVAPYVAQARADGIAVSHLRMDHPNLSAARNLGLAHARGEWVAFPDDDCWYESDTLAQVRAAARPELSGMVIQWREQALAERNLWPSEDVLTLRAWRTFRGGEASSICLFVRRELASRLGGFDARLGVGQWFGSAEETDFVLRALSTNARIERVHQAHVHHAFGPPAAMPAALLWRTVTARSRGTGALYAKHRLPRRIIARGLVMPVPRALLLWHGSQGLVRACAMVWGRAQGLLTWRRLV